MLNNTANEQTRAPNTVAAYLKRAESMLAGIAETLGLPDDSYPPPEAVVAYMTENAPSWKWATFRQKQASFVCRYEMEYERTGDPLFLETAAIIRGLPYSRCKPENEIGRTSSRKRKGIRQADFELLVANLSNPKKNSQYARLTALWLMAGLATGLRPCEWEHAQLLEQGTVLLVQNAKATNGRANGKERELPISSGDRRAVSAFLDAIQKQLSEGVTFTKIHQGCQQALARACASLWQRDPTKRYALYTMRHQFSANLKAVEPPEIVAERLGHRSVRTARRHYAPRRSAWSRYRDHSKLTPKVGPDGTLKSTNKTKKR